MRIYFYFQLQTQTLVCHEMAKAIMEKRGDAVFAGCLTKKSGCHLDFLKTQTEVEYEHIDVMDGIEAQALETEADDAKIEEWERRLGTSLMELVVADRQIGHRYVAGAHILCKNKGHL